MVEFDKDDDMVPTPDLDDEKIQLIDTESQIEKLKNEFEDRKLKTSQEGGAAGAFFFIVFICLSKNDLK